MKALDTTIPDRAAVPGAHFFLPLNLCRAAPLNPRRRFRKEAPESDRRRFFVVGIGGGA